MGQQGGGVQFLAMWSALQTKWRRARWRQALTHDETKPSTMVVPYCLARRSSLMQMRCSWPQFGEELDVMRAM
jgi:hypothetical protein